MGLARKQRDRLATANQADRCFGACPTFTTDQASASWSAREGNRHRAVSVARTFKRLRARSQSPFSLPVFSLSY